MIRDNEILINDLQDADLTVEKKSNILFNLIGNQLFVDRSKLIEYCNMFIESIDHNYSSKQIELVKEILENVDGNDSKLIETGFKFGSHFRRSELDYAYYLYEKSLKRAEELDDEINYGNGLNHLSFILNKKGDYDKSKELISKALAIGERLDDYFIKAKGYSLLGELFTYKGESDKALENYLKTMALNEELGDPIEISRSYNNIGLIYYRMLDYSKAKDYFLKSKAIKEELKDDIGLSFTYNNLGGVFFALKDYEVALEYYKKSLKIREDHNDINGVLAVCSNIGGIYYHFGQPHEALNWFQKAYELTIKLGDKHHAALILGNMGNVNLGLEQYDQALELAGKELKLAVELDERPLQQSAYAVYYRIYNQMENYKDALDNYIKYKNLSDEIYRNNRDKEIAKLHAEYELEKKERENEIYRLKNVELAEANQTINEKNQQLEAYKDDLILINKILRHDLLNNLTVLDASFNLFRNRKDPEVIYEAEQYVKKSFELILKMRDTELLSNDRVLREMDVLRVIRSVMVNYQKINFSIQGEGIVKANETLVSVIDNIVNNAIIHGGSTSIAFEIKAEGKNIKISIINNGQMIPPDQVDRIFDEGFSIGPQGNTGIGLYIAKKSLENLQGDIVISENKTDRVVFDILVPRV